MVAGPLLLGIGIGLLVGQVLAGTLIGLGAGITISAVVAALRPTDRPRRPVA